MGCFVAFVTQTYCYAFDGPLVAFSQNNSANSGSDERGHFGRRAGGGCVNRVHHDGWLAQTHFKAAGLVVGKGAGRETDSAVDIAIAGRNEFKVAISLQTKANQAVAIRNKLLFRNAFISAFYIDHHTI